MAPDVAMTGYYRDPELGSITDSMLGCAARHVLRGDDPADAALPGRHDCRAYSICWHRAASILLCGGLRPVPQAEPSTEGTLW